MKIIRPAGYSDDIPLAEVIAKTRETHHFRCLIADDTLLFQATETTAAHHAFFAQCQSIIQDSLDKIAATDDVPTLLASALEMLQFMDQNASECQQVTRIGSQLISCALMCVYKLPDSVKNRHSAVLDDAPWHLFEHLVKLLQKPHFDLTDAQASEANRHTDVPPYLFFHLHLHPKMIDELRINMRDVIAMMLDIERLDRSGSIEAFHHPVFQNDQAVCQEILSKQRALEAAISQGDAQTKKTKQAELRQALRTHQLMQNFPDTGFFCRTLSNYFSLLRMKELISDAVAIQDLSTSQARAAFLRYYVMIGEYVANRKLATKLRNQYRDVNWKAFDIIRNNLVHCEKARSWDITQALLDLDSHSAEQTIQSLQTELNSLNTTIQCILEQRFADTQNQLVYLYQQQYQPGAGENMLNPNQLTAFRRTDIYQAHVLPGLSKSRWNTLLTSPSACPRIDELLSLGGWLEQQADQDDIDVALGFSLHELVTAVYEQFQARLFAKWSSYMGAFACAELNRVLNHYPELRPFWYKVMNQELPYPSETGWKEHLRKIVHTDRCHAEVFVRVTAKLRAIRCPLPHARALANRFSQSRHHDASQPQDDPQQRGIRYCELAIAEIKQVRRLIDGHLFGQSFAESLIHRHVGIMNERLAAKRQHNPSYHRFCIERDRMLNQTYQLARRTKRQVPLPTEEIMELYDQMVVETDEDRQQDEQMMAHSEQQLIDAHRKQYLESLPDSVIKNSTFRKALEFHLARCISLFKRIKPLCTEEVAEFFHDNYAALKKCRNQLEHGDYLRELYSKNTSDIVMTLLDASAQIQSDLEQIRSSLHPDNSAPAPHHSVIPFLKRDPF